MAGFLKRVSRITMGKINAFLDGAEKPEEVLPMLLEELRQEHKKAIEAEATAVAALKRRKQDCQDIEDEIAKWSSRAELAVTESDDNLARTAIEKQMAAEKRLLTAQPAMENAENAAERAKQAREDLQTQVDTLVSKRDEILARASAAKQQEGVQRVLAGLEQHSGESILDAVSRMEEKVAEAEARAEAYADVAAERSGGDTEARFRELERKQNVDARLAELKQKMGKDSSEG